MSTSLVLLRELDKRHATMLRLAEALDWDNLDKEWQAAEIDFSALMKQPPLSAIASSERAEIQQLVDKVLAQQKLISERVLPWMEQVRPMLDSFDRYPLKPEPV